MKSSGSWSPAVVSQAGCQEGQDEKQTGRKRRWCFGVVAVFVTAFLVGGVVGLGVYFGMREKPEMVHTVTMSFYDDYGARLDEEVTVTGEEKIYTVPEQVSVIFNFKTGLMVLRDLEFLELPCMMSYFNESQFSTPEEMAETLTSKPDVGGGKVKGMIRNHLYGHGYPVKPYLISKMMSELCQNVTTTWMTPGRPEVVRGAVSLEELRRVRRQATDPAPDCTLVCTGEFSSAERIVALSRKVCVEQTASVINSFGFYSSGVLYTNSTCIEQNYYESYKYVYCSGIQQ